MTCVTGLKEVHSDLCVTGLMEVHSDLCDRAYGGT